MSMFDRVLRIGEGRTLKRLERLAAAVNDLEGSVRGLSDEALRARTEEFRARLAAGEALDDLLPEAFATVREAARRVLGQRPYDVQIMGGAALHLGNVAEMKTGEGKTLVSTLPAYLNALTGRGVHVITVNEYLATRDAAWMGRVHRFLGLSVGVLTDGMETQARKDAYLCDITYGTNNEFGFDYLRDNMAYRLEDRVQTGDFHFAIVDEVDSILIDEARTPLIISGAVDDASSWYAEFARIAAGLTRDVHYEVDEKKETVAVSEDGITAVEKALGISNLYEPGNTPLIGFMHNAVKAKELFVRDRDYIVTGDGDVLIVDEHTGRIMADRRYNDGMHQAVEAKEGVTIKAETQTLASITLQNYFRMYEKLSGMTGTAETEAAELWQIYGLGVVPIPTHRPVERVDQPDLIYRTEAAKDEAVLADVISRHKAGQPVLIGTGSVEASEHYSALLTRAGVPHSVLNAKQHEREAGIVAEAGHPGAVTVATNMAGRGTDIMLGGSPEHMARAALAAKDVQEQDPEWERAFEHALAHAQAQSESARRTVLAAGGLYVLGTERHESRRIDNQLRGRSGRQGDPGETRFYLSLEDRLMQRFKADTVDAALRRLNVPDEVPIEMKMVSRAVKGAQAQLEGQNSQARQEVLKYDEVMNRQRKVIYEERLHILRGEDLADQVDGLLERTLSGYVDAAIAQGYPEDWDLDALWAAAGALYPISVSVADVLAHAGADTVEGLDSQSLLAALLEDARSIYAEREETFGAETMRDLERRALLTVVDRKWRDHLYEMDYLRAGIGMRSYAQKTPLIEYETEGFTLFTAMMEAIAEETVRLLFSLQVVADIEAAAAPAPQQIQYSAPAEPGTEPADEPAGPGDTLAPAPAAAAADPFAGVQPNAMCPCGSGRKYKRCHGSPTRAEQPAAAS